ncbi:MAG: imidazole glycerol phosphate synthase subunit HisH [Alphaproteobacteria bacterium]
MSEVVAVVDYGAGNLRSVANALMRVASAMGPVPRIVVTAEADTVAAADRVVLPGVGAFADCMAGLSALDGMLAALDQAVRTRACPFLGICVGMQLLASVGREHGDHAGLGWLPGAVVGLGIRPGPQGRALKVPHMGWNTLRRCAIPHPVLAGLPEAPDVYFVHSYHFEPDDRALVRAETDYGGPIAAVVGRDTIVGTQFHPEKSQAVGLAILRNFLDWRP